MYFLGYWKETPAATSLYVTVAGRFFSTFLTGTFSAKAGVDANAVVEAPLDMEPDSPLELLLATLVGSFDFEQPTAARLVIISKLATIAEACLPLGVC
jgi:hypothetical protein